MRPSRTIDGKLRAIVFTAAAAALIVAISALTGCAASGESQSTQIGNAPTATVTSQADESAFNYDATIEPTVLVDNDIAKIEASSIEFDNDKLVISLSITNNYKAEVKVQGGTFGFSGNYVNNYMIEEGYFSTELKSKATDEQTISISTDSLTVFGINEIDEIGIGIQIISSKDYKDLLKDIFEIKTNLFDESKSYDNSYNSELPRIAEEYEGQIISASDTVLFDQSGTVLCDPAVLKNADGDYSLMLEVRNSGSKNFKITFSDVALNGDMAYEYTYTSSVVAPNKNAIVIFDLSSLAKKIESTEVDPASINNISFKFYTEDLKGNKILPETDLSIGF